MRIRIITLISGVMLGLLLMPPGSVAQAQDAQTSAPKSPPEAQRAEPQDDAHPEKLWVENPQHGLDPDAPFRFSSLSNLAERLSPAVVNILVNYAEPSGLGWWFSQQPGSERAGQGSGFIIHPDGYILTNYHVVEGARRVQIKLLDNSEHTGRVVGVDPQIDVALLKIDADRPLNAIALGDSDALSAGQQVLAIGNPLGLSHTVTTGIISALDRRDLGIQEDNYIDFIQTDASINPGNSGGPLIALSGEVIGINTAINRFAQGIGFAIPVSAVKKILPHLAKDGYLVRSWLGIRVQALDERLAETFELKAGEGVVVTEVVDKSPAESAGILAGDVILSFDSASLDNSQSLQWLASTAGAGREVDVQLLRDARRQTLKVKMEALPGQKRPNLPELDVSTKPAATPAPTFGVEVDTMTRAAARRLGARDQNGVVVTRVGEQSAANLAGIRKRDVILQVGNRDIADSKDFGRALKELDQGKYVRLKIMRDGRVVYLAVQN